MGQTITEKILSRVIGRPVAVGDIVHPVPELMTVHDWYVVNFDKVLQEFGVTKLFDPDRVLISTDHEPLAVTPQSSTVSCKSAAAIKSGSVTPPTSESSEATSRGWLI